SSSRWSRNPPAPPRARQPRRNCMTSAWRATRILSHESDKRELKSEREGPSPSLSLFRPAFTTEDDHHDARADQQRVSGGAAHPATVHRRWQGFFARLEVDRSAGRDQELRPDL